MASALTVALAGVLAAATLSAVGYVVHRYVLAPVEYAVETAENAEAKVHDLEQLLVGADSDADEGVLVRLQEDIADVKSETKRSNRLQVEEAHNLSELVRLVAEREDDIEVEVRDDAIYLRGDEMPDGGTLSFPRT